MNEIVSHDLNLSGGGRVLITNQNITVTFADGATATIANDIFTREMQNTGEVLISPDDETPMVQPFIM